MNYITDLHCLFMLQLSHQNHGDTQCLMEAYMRRHNILFYAPTDIPGSRYWCDDHDPTPEGTAEKFYDKVNSVRYDDIRNFSMLCLDFLDMRDTGTEHERLAAYHELQQKVFAC